MTQTNRRGELGVKMQQFIVLYRLLCQKGSIIINLYYFTKFYYIWALLPIAVNMQTIETKEHIQ